MATQLTPSELESVATLCLMAAVADGGRSDEERDQIQQIMSSLDQSGGTNVLALYQKVLLRQADVASAAAPLASPETKTLAYEMALGVCNADGIINPREKEFLERLRSTLAIEAAPTRAMQQASDGLAGVDLATAQAATPVAAADLDTSITRYATIAAALELLPHTLATAAIIPLQMKMVYSIGKSFGYDLDRGHIREFLATIGLGMTSQVLEGFANRLLGGAGRSILGGLLGSAVGAAGSSAIAFASTYALGHVAKSYYASGRTLTVDQLKATFADLTQRGQSLYSSHEGNIASQARSMDPSKLLPLIRGL